MIEVEKKFQPTEEQLEKMLEGAEFLGEVVNHDVYYDYPDYSNYIKNICLRDRNGVFELKIMKSKGVHTETEDKKEIEEYFNVDKEKNLEDFMTENFIPIMEYKTKRKKYKKIFKNKAFVIDVDATDFLDENRTIYQMCEIEYLVENEIEAQEALNSIMNLAEIYDFNISRTTPKHEEYLRITKPEIYKELFKDK